LLPALLFKRILTCVYSKYNYFLTPSSYESGILFGNPTNNAGGAIIYNPGNSKNGMLFRANGFTEPQLLDEQVPEYGLEHRNDVFSVPMVVRAV